MPGELPPNGGNVQLGCGVAVRLIKGNRYVYFWTYERTATGCRRVWTYVGPVSRTSTPSKITDLLLGYHLRVRRETDRRIGRLLARRLT